MTKDTGVPRSSAGRAVAADAVEPVPVSSKADIPNAAAIAGSLTEHERNDVVYGSCVMSSEECVCKSPSRDKLVALGLFREPTSAGGRLRTRLGKRVAQAIEAQRAATPKSDAVADESAVAESDAPKGGPAWPLNAQKS